MGALVDAETPNVIMVTGAAGFIGSHLCVRLRQAGRHVIGVDNFDPYYRRLDKERNVEIIVRAGADFREADIVDHDGFSSLVDVVRPDAIVHLAAKAGVRNSLRFPRQYLETNLVGTQNVLEACRRNDVERVVMASTSSVYGRTEHHPFDEEDPCARPLHPYAVSKRSAELVASMYAEQFGLQVTVLRLFTVYGERGRPDMMPRLLLDSLTTGSPVPIFEGDLARDWTHIDDAIAAFTAAIDTPLGFRIINAGRGEPVPLAGFIETLERIAGRKAVLTASPRPPSEVLSTHASTTRMRELLGVEPQISVAEGVERLWNWWSAQH